VKNFTLTLYAFHLYQTLGDDPKIVSPRAENLWNSLTAAAADLPFPELHRLKSKLICYDCNNKGQCEYKSQSENRLEDKWLTDSKKAINFDKIPTASGLDLCAELQPFRLHDTYCVDFTLFPTFPDSPILPNITPDQLYMFQPAVLLQKIEANLGKSVIIYGEEQYGTKPHRDQAQVWVNHFCSDRSSDSSTPEYLGEIQLFDCPSFVFEAPGLTLIVCLSKPNQLDTKQAKKKQGWLRDLLWTKAKIEWSYCQAKEAYQKARHIYSQLEKKVKDFYLLMSQKQEERLTNLDDLLKNLPQNLLDYSCCLRDLKAQHFTIKMNQDNFQTCLNHLWKPEKQQEVWSELADQRYPRYLAQTQGYIESIEPGKELFTDLINTIRATAEVEQAKNEKELQDYIQALGFGIGAGAILASASGSITQDWHWPNGQKIESPILLPHPFLIGFFGSLLVAVVVFDREKHSLKQKRNRQESNWLASVWPRIKGMRRNIKSD